MRLHQAILSLKLQCLTSSILINSLYERDDRCLFLYVSNSADFQMFFSSEGLRSRFHSLSQQMIDKEGGLTELEAPEDEVLTVSYNILRYAKF